MGVTKGLKSNLQWWGGGGGGSSQLIGTPTILPASKIPLGNRFVWCPCNHSAWSPGHNCNKWRDHHDKRTLCEFVPYAIQRFQNYFSTSFMPSELNSKPVNCKVRFREMLARLPDKSSPCNKNSFASRSCRSSPLPVKVLQKKEKKKLIPNNHGMWPTLIIRGRCPRVKFTIPAIIFWVPWKYFLVEYRLNL